MRRRRNVKIVATLGPASKDAVMIRKLFGNQDQIPVIKLLE
jgi:pyruvate kinase